VRRIFMGDALGDIPGACQPNRIEGVAPLSPLRQDCIATPFPLGIVQALV
jgi:hypothetical protein